MLRSDNFSLLQASIVTIAEPSLPLLISSPQRLTAWWCRFMCILFRVWLLHLSMCGALSDPPHKGQVAGPVVWLNLLVYVLSVCIVFVLYFRTCSCSLKVTFGMDQKLVTELGMRKGLCSSLPCAGAGLCCTLRRIMQFLPELVKQCICVSFTKVMVGVRCVLPEEFDREHTRTGNNLCQKLNRRPSNYHTQTGSHYLTGPSFGCY